MSNLPTKPKELIPTITKLREDEKQIVVDAKVLQDYLGSGVNTRAAEWSPRRIEAGGLVKGYDYFVEEEISEAGRTTFRYYFTIDAAKHIGMMEKTEKGFEIREYFISLETYLKEMDRAGWIEKFEQYKQSLLEKAEKEKKSAYNLGIFNGENNQVSRADAIAHETVRKGMSEANDLVRKYKHRWEQERGAKEKVEEEITLLRQTNKWLTSDNKALAKEIGKYKSRAEKQAATRERLKGK